MYEEIKKYLEKSPNARERKNKNKFIAWLLFNKYNLKQEVMTQDLLEEIILKASDYDRFWRMNLRDNPSLRGKDYEDKVKVEQQKMMELGYESGYYKYEKTIT